MGSYSVEFSGSQSGTYAGTYYVRVTITDSYNAATNSSTVAVSKVEFKAPYTFGSVPVFGKVTLNGTVCAHMRGTTSGSTTSSSANSYSNCSYSSSFGSVTVAHGSDGKASVTVGISKSDDVGYSKFCIVYSGNGWGVSTDQSKSQSITTQVRTLTINPNGGSWNGSSSSQSFSQAPTTTKTIANPTRTGYNFSGWTLTGGGSLNGTTYTFGGTNGTLTAGWNAITYTVTYNANGGSDAPAAQTKNYGETLILSADEPIRAGYTFLGWATTSDATVAQYQASSGYSANASATLYAVWQVITFTLSATVSPKGIVANILRTVSPNGGSTGLLNNGDTLYYGDTVKISWSVSGGYTADTLTINGEDVSSLVPAEKTISSVEGNMTVVLTVKIGAVVYIHNEMYQAFIYDGANWEQYEAYIYNGANWDAY